jgi:outer membrane protein
MKEWLAIGTLVMALGAAFGSAAAQTIDGFPDTTLAGIYELAIDNDLTIAEARAQFRVGAEERRLGRAGLLPQVRGGYTYSEADTKSRGTFSAGGQTFPNDTDTDADTNVWDVSLAQPIFNAPAWFRFQQGVQLSKQAEASFSMAQQQLILRVVTVYFEVLRASANLKASRAQESALEAQLDQVRQRFEVGMVAITDVHEARAAYDLAVALRVADEGQLGTSREQLSVLTGRGHGDLWVLDEEFPVVEPDPPAGDAWVEFAQLNNFDIQVARYSRDAAQRGARAAASEHLPKVDLALTYTDNATDVVQRNLNTGVRSTFPTDQERTVVALNVSVPIYTGGFTSAARRQAAAVYDTRLAGYEGTVRLVTQETRALHIRVMSAVAISRARAQAVTSTRSALEAAEVGYNVGTRNVVDVLLAQREYFSAVRDYENSIIDYVQDLALLKRLAGTLSPDDIYELNRWLYQPPATTASGR